MGLMLSCGCHARWAGRGLIWKIPPVLLVSLQDCQEDVRAAVSGPPRPLVRLLLAAFGRQLMQATATARGTGFHSTRGPSEHCCCRRPLGYGAALFLRRQGLQPQQQQQPTIWCTPTPRSSSRFGRSRISPRSAGGRSCAPGSLAAAPLGALRLGTKTRSAREVSPVTRLSGTPRLPAVEGWAISKPNARTCFRRYRTRL